MPSLHDEGELSIRRELCLLPPGRERAAFTPQLQHQQPPARTLAAALKCVSRTEASHTTPERD